jgi:hypothetical protein
MAINRRALSAQADSGRRPGHQHWSALSATAYLRPALLYNTSLTLFDAINNAGVSAGRFASFRVLSRTLTERFRSSALFLCGVRFPAAPQEGAQVREL